MRRCTLDHLVVVSPILPLGARFVERQLGVQLQPGGEHVRMGTHNLLLRLGDSFYLEVIAPNSMAPLPTRPRWFGLDELSAQASPRLAHWVARTEQLDTADEGLRKVFGEVEPMSRGVLSWKISIQPDGHLPLEGAIPSLIDWGDAEHPAQRLDDKGCQLQHLEISYPDPGLVERQLEAIGFTGPVSVLRGERYVLRASISTPGGLVIL
ncbi:VOC family protein [Pseudomonas sp. PSKL.D1]|uniref:VOC family protein n=1 Tax=Pseudomonas sp. PSKL.D1 TaxID=3029060 RepID=UPI002380CA88|nr:VOC family protein [Pseudomonas sp. PSKL.D1]WDY55846.1 VOC family protein [Pseudomonas sp. PSKL.D1]